VCEGGRVENSSLCGFSSIASVGLMRFACSFTGHVNAA
jgi:hypothetical protein